MPNNSWGLPYPLGTDAADGPDAIKDLADAVGPYLNRGYANAAARDALIPSPVEGMRARLLDTHVTGEYDGAAWLPMGGATQLYTPTWTASTTNPAIGNGQLNGRWEQIGKWVFVSIEIIMGSTTTYGAGSWILSLPTQARTSSRIGLPGLAIDQSAGDRFLCYGYWAGPSTTLTCTYHATNTNLAGSAILAAGLTNAFPMAWANTDTLMFQGVYEATT